MTPEFVFFLAVSVTPTLIAVLWFHAAVYYWIKYYYGE